MKISLKYLKLMLPKMVDTPMGRVQKRIYRRLFQYQVARILAEKRGKN